MLKQTVLVAFGGPSPEHEVSVLTGLQVMAALAETPYQPVPLYVAKDGRWLTGSSFAELESFKDLKKLEASGIPCSFVFNEFGKPVLQQSDAAFFKKATRWDIDIVIPAFHGSDGENGGFQGLCEVYNLPYTGSGVLGSAIGMDKMMAKRVVSQSGWNVVEGISFFEHEWIDEQPIWIKKIEALGYPVFVKPVHLGSSIGVAHATTKKSLVDAIETAFRYDAHLLVEKAVSPLLEINCSVLGTPESAEASVCEQPVGAMEVLSYQDKYLSGDTSKGMASAGRIIPAPISEKQTHDIQNMAVGIFKTLGCYGLVRIDFLMNSKTGRVYFNEINTIPGSFSFYLWNKSGLNFPGLIVKLITIGFERHRVRNGRVRSYETNLLSSKAAQGLKGLKTKKS